MEPNLLSYGEFLLKGSATPGGRMTEFIFKKRPLLLQALRRPPPIHGLHDQPFVRKQFKNHGNKPPLWRSRHERGRRRGMPRFEELHDCLGILDCVGRAAGFYQQDGNHGD
jgi:hypothetical protein